MRIAVISDSHLSQRSPECVANWHAARRAVARLAPDLTIHLGDITLDGQRQPAELEFAASLMQLWPTEMRCLPGNHDMGDGSGEEPLDHDLLASYKRFFGADRWVVKADGWNLIGINAQLLGTGDPLENDQLQWLNAVAAGLSPHSLSMLFLHRPVLPCVGDVKKRGRYIAETARKTLLEGPLKSSLRWVLSGHTHQYIDTTSRGVRYLWMPSSGFVLPDGLQPRVGEKIVGIGLLETEGLNAWFDLWCPDGMVRHDLSALQAFEATVTDH